MSANASPAKDDPNLVTETNAVLDRLIDIAAKDEDEAPSQEDSARCSASTQSDPGLTHQEVEDHSACGYSSMPSLAQEVGRSQSVESLDDFLSSPIPMSGSHADSFDDLYQELEEPQFSDDFLPRDTSPETVGQDSNDDEWQDESDDEVRHGLVAGIAFMERMMLFIMDAGVMDVPQDPERMAGGDHAEEHDLD